MGDVKTYAPLIFRRVNDVSKIRELDTSKFARGNDLCCANLDYIDEESDEIKNDKLPENKIRMKNKDFRDKLDFS